MCESTDLCSVLSDKGGLCGVVLLLSLVSDWILERAFRRSWAGIPKSLWYFCLSIFSKMPWTQKGGQWRAVKVFCVALIHCHRILSFLGNTCKLCPIPPTILQAAQHQGKAKMYLTVYYYLTQVKTSNLLRLYYSAWTAYCSMHHHGRFRLEMMYVSWRCFCKHNHKSSFATLRLYNSIVMHNWIIKNVVLCIAWVSKHIYL